MRIATTLCLFAVLVVCSPAAARADPFVFSTTLITTGTFDCRSAITCSGEGTSSVTIGSGANSGTLTFTGVNSTFDVTPRNSSVTLGFFELTAPEGFTFPTHATNPELPMLRFRMTMTHTAPVPDQTFKNWQFGPGGLATLTLQQGTSHASLDAGPNPFNYGLIVYTVRPFPFTLASGTTALTADVAAIPEPATLVLLGTGLIGAACARRRRQNPPA